MKSWLFGALHLRISPLTLSGRAQDPPNTHQETKMSAKVSVAIKRAKTIQYIIQRTCEDTGNPTIVNEANFPVSVH